jgi:hypothetical protein
MDIANTLAAAPGTWSVGRSHPGLRTSRGWRSKAKRTAVGVDVQVKDENRRRGRPPGSKNKMAEASGD